jgi:hypothetical protein
MKQEMNKPEQQNNFDELYKRIEILENKYDSGY